MIVIRERLLAGKGKSPARSKPQSIESNTVSGAQFEGGTPSLRGYGFERRLERGRLAHAMDPVVRSEGKMPSSQSPFEGAPPARGRLVLGFRAAESEK